jgi:hypothetical protein
MHTSIHSDIQPSRAGSRINLLSIIICVTIATY